MTSDGRIVPPINKKFFGFAVIEESLREVINRLRREFLEELVREAVAICVARGSRTVSADDVHEAERRIRG
ncbi:hypothetical protein CAEBREN_21192 [Caenorhabditis brenneri]|uniref:Transcription factor CBF/NF-Y/archaeal histone domain-containing protein n=1 Tax=Caenorhabditis brenneri TaxID=135651 RepID=G0NCU5_CAEBE|nr:hypothetical protein CAEBREN_21192 [Caenorhabditis brenneri]